MPKAPEFFKVVINHEEQYSIWPIDRPSPPGWREAGKAGNKDDCMAYIKKVWADVEPGELRRSVESLEARAKLPD